MKLKDFARVVGLSPTTVSRALSGYPEVSPQTRARVAAEAERLGYRPNVNAVRLATGRAGAIGIVMTHGGEYQFSEFMSGLADRLAGQDIDILVTPMADHDRRDDVLIHRRLAESRRVDALIISSPRPADPRVALLNDMGFPFIVHGRAEHTPPHAWMDIDNEGATRRATEHLLDLGHRRIALINGRAGFTFVAHRERGYRTALAARDLAFDPRLLLHGSFTDEIGFRLAGTALSQTPRPTAIIAGSMMTALGVYRAIHALGLTIGRDVSVIAHDDVFPYLTAENMAPPLSTTRSSIRAAGSRIAELLGEILAGRLAEEIMELWPVDLIMRESSRPAP